MNFIFRWIQPYKERVHPRYEFRGETDVTCKVPEQIEQDKVLCRATILFNTVVHVAIKGPQRAFNIMNPPPTVIIFLACILSTLTLCDVLIHVFEDSWIGLGGILLCRAIRRLPDRR